MTVPVTWPHLRRCTIDEQKYSDARSAPTDDRVAPAAAAHGETANSTDARTRSVGLVVAVAILALGAAALLFADGDDALTGEATEVADAVDVRGEALPRFPGEQQPDPAAGQPAPAVHGVDIDGGQVSIQPGDGPMAVIFLAHWCPHCQRKVPEVQALLDQDQLPDNVDIVSVSTDVAPDRDNYPPSAWFDEVGWTPPVLVDDPDGTAATSYGLTGFPFTVFIGSDGAVLGRIAGAVEPEVFAGIMEELAGR